ncbi:LysR family transcriptional regulator [Levilactobacillus wangkuiensis]|uniref:LysR family transcriptional regulator n=1 Tax=Levilactobacillus wangkuiensis TaxID=2799566 RepID=UPI001942FD66|nr:LysR family transcriptional regulator [Levilactobacillus wangkuiensis]
MLDNYLLQELVTFAQTGTLAKTAATLNVTQPTVTRGMQKLETDLGVQLFDRQPNRIRLTATGKLAAREAAKLLQANHDTAIRIQNFDRNQRVLKVAATLPGPMIVLQSLKDQLPANLQLAPVASLPEPVESLRNHAYTLVFTNHPLTATDITNQLIGTENLAIHLNKFMYQANQSTVTFADLAGLSFVVPVDIGPWRAIIQDNIPDAKFFYQKEREALAEITKFSDFPYFATNVSPFDPTLPLEATVNDNRRLLPISDAAAHMSIYANYLTAATSRVTPVITTLRASWPET